MIELARSLWQVLTTPVWALRERRTVRLSAEGSYRLLVLGVRGRPSYQVRVPRGEGRWWARLDGSLVNAEPVPLPGRTRASRWVLLDSEGRMLADGRWDHPVDGAEIPIGRVVAFLGLERVQFDLGKGRAVDRSTRLGDA